MGKRQPMSDGHQERLRPPWRRGRTLRVLAGIIVVVVVCQVVSQFISKPLRISTETTYITEPLKSDGKQVDYFAAIEKGNYPDSIATDENGFRLLVQHVDMSPEYEPWQFSQVCEKLGLNADTTQPNITYQDQYEFLKAYGASEEFDEALVEKLLADDRSDVVCNDEATSEVEFANDQVESNDDSVAMGNDRNGLGEGRLDEWESRPDPVYLLGVRTHAPWTFDDLPMMEEWLRQNGRALDLLGDAVRKPAFRIPLARKAGHDGLAESLGANAMITRAFARGLSARAHYRIGIGDIDGAIDDIITCKRLGRHIGHGAMLVNLLVGIAIEGIGDSIGIADASEPFPTKAQLQRFMDELDHLPRRAELAEMMRFERYLGLDLLQRMAHDGESLEELIGWPIAPARYTSGFGCDWNIVAKSYNKHFDSIIAGGVGPPHSSFDPMIFISRRARSQRLADTFGSLLTPTWGAAKEVTCRARCAQQMRQITLAMLIYERDHGTLPPAYSVDAQGNPLHSWRVLLLPYLGQDELYEKIRLDEPWSSEHNRQFHGNDVAFYRCPSVPTAKPGETTYAVVVGPEMPFVAGDGKKLTDFGPERKHLILLVEREAAVCWMNPDQEVPQSRADVGINESRSPFAMTEQVTNGISSPHPGGAHFGFRDGAIAFLSQTIDIEEFRRLLRGTDRLDY